MDFIAVTIVVLEVIILSFLHNPWNSVCMLSKWC